MAKKFSPRQISQGLGLLFALLLVFGFIWTAYFITHPRLPQSGEPPLLYANQVRDDLSQAFTHSIDAAQESIWLMVYTLTDARIIQALNQKAVAGVDVHVVVDGKASAKVQSRLNPKIKLLKRFGQGLMHLKILVIDKRQVWLGSANMTGDSLRMHGNLVMAMENPALAAAVIERAEGLKEEGESRHGYSENFTFADQNLELWFLPTNHAIPRLIELIRGAQKSIKIAMFTWTRYDLAEALVAAQKRGVSVEIVLDHYAGRGTGAEIVKILKAGNIPVRFSQGAPLLHYKCMEIDEEILVNGSANWTKAAFSQNDDCFIVLSKLNEDQKKTLENLWQVLKNESRPAD